VILGLDTHHIRHRTASLYINSPSHTHDIHHARQHDNTITSPLYF
jgi:hypothetical protein